MKAARGLRWHPAPFVVGSAACHVGAALAVAAQPQIWPWTVGLLALDHAAATAAGLCPRSHLLGVNWTRLPAAMAESAGVAITIDDGPDPEVTPRVLEVLRSHGARATFFCIGARLRRHPEHARAIHAAGHVIENHSFEHAHTFSLRGPRALRADIERAQDCIGELTGRAPRFFRAPAGLRNPFLDYVLARQGLTLASWTRRGFDTVDGNAQAVLERLGRRLAGGDILLLHDGHAARTPTGAAVVLEVLPRLLDRIAARGLRPVTLDAALARPAFG
jgi:peptidoglycan/xylan/chitin deacetylase (PgdA/CDA1 family)